jgi:hypothetical protein
MNVWNSLAIKHNPGVSETELFSFEQKHGVKLPLLFRLYLLHVNGMPENEVDDETINFLSLQAIDSGSNCYIDNKNHFNITVADYLIYSHFYTLKLNRVGDKEIGMFVSDGTSTIFICSSFQEFLQCYLKERKTIANIL